MRDYRIISADTHLEVSPDRWRGFVEPAYREWAPQVVRLENGGDAWLMPGKSTPVPLGLNFSAGRGWRNLKPSGIAYAENPAGSGDGRQRLREMDADGVDAEILFPAVAGQRSMDGLVPRDAYAALARGYNDWLSQEFCAADPDRLLGCALLPISTAEDAAAELRRVAGLPGIRTAILHQWPNGTGKPAPEDDLFWEAAVETGLPLSVHVSFGGGAAGDTPPEGFLNFAPINKLLTRDGGDTGYSATQLITSGVFDRFPGLRIAYAETGAGWVPYYAEQADDNYKRHRYWAQIELAHEPSWYIKRHFLWGFQVDPYGVKNRHEVGVENLMWATDFPHVATDWPESRRVIEDLFAGVPEDEKRAMICENAARFYKLRP
jgi:predicted TIM-barrel fold metal-dependent hydrolase